MASSDDEGNSRVGADSVTTSGTLPSAGLSIEALDECARIIFLCCPGEKVVELQGYFEIHEAIGIVRTLDLSRSLISIVTTESMLPDALTLLDAIHPTIRWWPTPPPTGEEKLAYLGYQKKS